MPNNVFILDGSPQYSNLFLQAGWCIVGDPAVADLVVFTGGEDVTPAYYNDEKHPKTYNNERRDEFERRMFNTFKQRLTPMVGICRGGQFLNVMSGGKMYQHVSNHTSPHMLVDTLTGERIFVSSTHHQMMRPGKGAHLVAVAHELGYKEYMEGKTLVSTNDGPDIEVLYYPSTQALCFQPHPEFFSLGDVKYRAMRDYFFGLLEQYFSFKINK